MRAIKSEIEGTDKAVLAKCWGIDEIKGDAFEKWLEVLSGNIRLSQKVLKKNSFGKKGKSKAKTLIEYYICAIKDTIDSDKKGTSDGN